MEEALWAALVGFIAQMIDGALGMGYGITSNSLLLSLGVPPAVASASVHVSEVFTTAASGASHLKLGNVDKGLFVRLLAPGAACGFLGAYALVSAPLEVIRPAVNLYLAALGATIILRALRYGAAKRPVPKIGEIGLGGLGGFLDAVGGGGWGPIVTSTLVAAGHNPRTAIGSVNAAEFFVTLVQSAAFLVLLRSLPWAVVLGLIAGGVAAAPIAARICGKLPPRAMMAAVGALVLALSARNLIS